MRQNILTSNTWKYNVIPLILILYPYSLIYFPTVSLSYILIVFYSLYLCLVSIKNQQSVYAGPIVLISVLVLISLISLFCNEISDELRVIVETFKIVSWGFFISMIPSRLNNIDLLTEKMVFFSVVSSLYFYLQLFVYKFFSIRLKNVFNFGIVRHYTKDLRNLPLYRASSFYSEPSHFVLQIAITLILILKSQKNNKDKSLIFFLMLTLILNTSSTGIVLLFTIILQELYYRVHTPIFKMLITIFLIFILTYLYLNFNLFLEYISTINDNFLMLSGKLKNMDSLGRLGGSYTYLSKLQGVQKYIGYGIGNEYTPIGSVVYLNSVTRISLQTGYLGLFFVFVFLVVNYFRSLVYPYEKMILTVYILVSISGGALFSALGIFILSIYFILVKDRTCKKTRRLYDV